MKYKALLKLALQVCITVAIFYFLGLNLVKSWSNISSYHWHLNPPLFCVSFFLFIMQTLFYPFIWYSVLKRLKLAPPFLPSFKVYLTAEFTRYIPGNVWHVISRVIMAEKLGVSKSFCFLSMFLELVTKLAATAILFLLTIIFWPALTKNNISLIAGSSLVGVIVLVILLHPQILAFGMKQFSRLTRKPDLDASVRFGYRSSFEITGLWILNWILGGIGFFVLAASLYPVSLSSIWGYCGIYAIAWSIGFLSLITPSGLGFRESTIVFLLPLAGFVPDSAAGFATATILSLAARISSTVAEVLCVAVVQAVRDTGNMNGTDTLNSEVSTTVS